MTNYFKVYITSKKSKITRYSNIKDPKKVIEILEKAKNDGCIRYSIVKRIKGKSDVAIDFGFLKSFDKEKVLEKLKNTDYRIMENQNGGKNIVKCKKNSKKTNFGNSFTKE